MNCISRTARFTAVMAACAVGLPSHRVAAGQETRRADPPTAGPTRDPRDIRTGRTIPDEGYCDQPYVVVTRDGNWLCTLTTGPGREGDRGQHVAATVSTDKGRSWTKLIDIEPSRGPEASWVVPLVTPAGRVYAFYTYNGDNVRTLRGKPIRADVIGWFAFRYSDDHGRTWSRRHRLPMRLTACDRGNDWRGKVQIFWGIDKPSVAGGRVYFAFTKLGKYMLEKGEGWLYRSDNVLTEKDPAKLRWELLPEGDRGVRAEKFGSVQEEHNVAPLRDPKGLYCVYRTTKGYPCHAYSADGGRSWTKPAFMTYGPAGPKIKNPRACPKLWRTKGGKFLFWFHNHSSRSYRGRNPAWIVGGQERNGRIHWSQPEILLYDPNPNGRMSYPDLVEQDGRYWVTETNKTIARVHEIDKTLLEGLWSQGEVKTIARDGLLLEISAKQLEAKEKEAKLPRRLDLTAAGGLSLGLWVRLNDLSAGQVLLDSRDAEGKGVCLSTTKRGALRIDLRDGRTAASWDSDAGILRAGKLHHVAAIVDAGPRIIAFVVDGVFCDGGDGRQYGWGRYKGALGDVRGSGGLRIAPSLKGELKSLRVYGRYLRTSEAVGNYHAGSGSR